MCVCGCVCVFVCLCLSGWVFACACLNASIHINKNSAWHVFQSVRNTCGCRESNPGHKHGGLVWCRHTTCALAALERHKNSGPSQQRQFETLDGNIRWHWFRFMGACMYAWQCACMRACMLWRVLSRLLLSRLVLSCVVLCCLALQFNVLWLKLM